MISGWGLNEQGKKISKRDLESYSDQSGFNRYDPLAVIERYGADALRYWAAGSRLGHDLRYHEKDVRVGRKLVIKLWNVARLVSLYCEDYDRSARISVDERPLEDRWVLQRLAQLVVDVTAGFEANDYAIGREALDRFFWSIFCDNYLEIIKERLRAVDVFGTELRQSAQDTLLDVLRTLLALFAPFVPFITEEIFQRFFSHQEADISLHEAQWPESGDLKPVTDVDARMAAILELVDAARFSRTRDKIPTGAIVEAVGVKLFGEAAASRDVLVSDMPTLMSALRSCRVFLTEDLAMATNKAGIELVFHVGDVQS